ncbi:MAG: acyl-CoA dehydrogenase family protein, partial [Acidimicrobiales bacterium]
GPEGSIAKLASAELNKDLTSFCLDLLGVEGTLYPGGYVKERPRHANPFVNPHQAFLRARANSIEGGTSEIMRNILGERVLGLPGEPRTDKELPWTQVPRS